VRVQLRQHATRKKHLEEVCAQLDCPVPPAAAQAAAAAATAAAAASSADPGAEGGAEGEGSDSGGGGALPAPGSALDADPAVAAPPAQQQQQAQQQQAAGGAAAAAAAAAVDMEWRAQRLECLMYRVLWVSEVSARRPRRPLCLKPLCLEPLS
jgi:hypothetical protein